MKKTESENERKIKRDIERASFVCHGAFLDDGRGWREPQVDHCARSSSVFTVFHFHHHHPKMPTELPYAADAEDSLSYDELDVRPHSLKWFVGCADARSFRCSASNTGRRYHSRM